MRGLALEERLIKPINTVRTTTSTYEGTPSSFVFVVDNPGDATSVTVDITDSASGRAVISTATVYLASGPTAVELPWESDGYGWRSRTKPASERTFQVRVTAADGATSDGALTLTVKPRPVVTLHGLASDASTWSDYNGWTTGIHPAWRTYAVGDGAYPGTMDTGSFNPLYTPKTVKENAEQAWTYIDALRKDLNAWEVDVVGHSMGGIITRQMLFDRGWEAQGAIRQVVMLGTPNGGSFCANILPIPSNYPLFTSVMTGFNVLRPRYPGVSSTLYYSSPVPSPCSSLLNGLDGIEFSDPVVQPWSATAVHVDRFIGEIFGTFHTSMTTSRGLFDEVVAPALALAPGDSPPRSRAGGRVVPQVDAEHQMSEMGVLRPGEDVSVRFEVRAGESALVAAASDGSVRLKVVDESGEATSLVHLEGESRMSATLLDPRDVDRTFILRGTVDAATAYSVGLGGSDVKVNTRVAAGAKGDTLRIRVGGSQADLVESIVAVVEDLGGGREKIRIPESQLTGTGDRYSVRLPDAGRSTAATDCRGCASFGDTVIIKVVVTLADGRERTIVEGVDGIG
jgi:pimeloyl-ACP methyl ester carboxylesterase